MRAVPTPLERARAGVGHAALLAVLAALGTPGALYAQSVGDSLPVLRATADDTRDFRLDGRLDEAFWSRAPLLSDFRQLEPVEGEPATETTEVRVVVDDDAVLVGIHA